jgi:two-component system, OmpR family, response regulator MprA
MIQIEFKLEAREIRVPPTQWGETAVIIDLTPLEAKLFNALWVKKNQTMERFDLELAMWGDEVEGQSSNTVDVYIGYLRKKLWKKAGLRDAIVSVRGKGYRLEVSGD